MSDVTPPALQLREITKRYPGVTALNSVSLEVATGEIHALVGENGAGKSTLMKTCSGAVIPDHGTIVVHGRTFRSMTPRQSEENGIAVIYQEFNLVGELSIAENIFLGRPKRKGVFIDMPAMVREAERLFRLFDLPVDPTRPVKDLTVGYQQIVEIAKAIACDARILIMDEPTAPLTGEEVEHLFRIVDALKASGVTIIYISHRMDEIFQLSDRITVLRDGTKIRTVATKDTDVNELVKLMVGRSLSETFPPRLRPPADATRDVILEVDKLTGNGVEDLSFQLHSGEILGLAGLIGAGRTELAELLFGYRPIESGSIVLRGKPFLPPSPRRAIDAGIALVPEDRKNLGLLLDLDIRDNITIAILRRISRFFVRNRAVETETAEAYRKSISIKATGLTQRVKNLSGGNQQKVVIAKWLASNADLIIFDEPTRGIDVGAKYEIYKLINALAEKGKGIIMISSEMEEVIGMSDRIVILSEGRITGTVDRDRFDRETILGLASGAGAEYQNHG